MEPVDQVFLPCILRNALSLYESRSVNTLLACTTSPARNKIPANSFWLSRETGFGRVFELTFVSGSLPKGAKYNNASLLHGILETLMIA